MFPCGRSGLSVLNAGKVLLTAQWSKVRIRPGFLFQHSKREKEPKREKVLSKTLKFQLFKSFYIILINICAYSTWKTIVFHMVNIGFPCGKFIFIFHVENNFSMLKSKSLRVVVVLVNGIVSVVLVRLMMNWWLFRAFWARFRVAGILVCQQQKPALWAARCVRWQACDGPARRGRALGPILRLWVYPDFVCSRCRRCASVGVLSAFLTDDG